GCERGVHARGRGRDARRDNPRHLAHELTAYPELTRRLSSTMPAPPNTTSTNTPAPAAAARRQLSTLDKWLPVWIGLAMIAGLLLGLLVMMYPVLAKVRYDKIAAVTGDKKLLVSSLVLN